MSDAHAAARWIADLLDGERISYLVVGGLAARAHGATRPLADIDLYVPNDALQRVASLVSDHVTRAPARHVGDQWDIVFMQLEFAGQKIELGGGDDVRITPPGTGEWVEQHVDLQSGVWLDVGGGVEMRVMARHDLIAYKRILDRDVDREDVEALEGPDPV